MGGEDGGEWAVEDGGKWAVESLFHDSVLSGVLLSSEAPRRTVERSWGGAICGLEGRNRVYSNAVLAI